MKSLPEAPVLNTWSQTVVLFGELEDLAGGGFWPECCAAWLLSRDSSCPLLLPVISLLQCAGSLRVRLDSSDWH